MIRKRNKNIAFGAIALALALAVQTIPMPRSLASDHIDSPIITHDRSADIDDNWSFLDPNDNAKGYLRRRCTRLDCTQSGKIERSKHGDKRRSAARNTGRETFLSCPNDRKSGGK